MRVSEKNSSFQQKIDRIFSLLIILLLFLGQYKGIGSIISLGELLLLLCLGVIIISNPYLKPSKINRIFVVFYLVVLLTVCINSFFDYFVLGSAITIILRMLFYAVLIYEARMHFKFSYIEKFYYFCIFIASAYLIIQYLYHTFLGGYLPIYINYSFLFPPEARAASLETYYRWAFRPSSLFLEPSYFSKFVLPGVGFLVFTKNKPKFQIITVVVSCLALVLSTANSAIIGLLIIFVAKLFDVNKKNTIKNMIIRILLLTAMIVAYVFFTWSNEMAYQYNRLYSGGSFDQRILRGLIIFQQLPLFHQIFGVGVNNLDSYIEKYGLYTQYDESNLNYSASSVQILNFCGIIGFIMLVLLLLSYIPKIKKLAAGDRTQCFVQFYLLIFNVIYSQVVFSSGFAFPVIILESIIEENKNKQKGDIEIGCY